MIPFGFTVVESQFFANFAGAHPHDGIAAGVVTYRAAKHLRSDHPLPEAVDVPFEGVSDDEAKEVLGALAAREGPAGQHPLQVLAYQYNLLRTEFLRLTQRRRTGSGHDPLRTRS